MKNTNVLLLFLSSGPPLTMWKKKQKKKKKKKQKKKKKKKKKTKQNKTKKKNKPHNNNHLSISNRWMDRSGQISQSQILEASRSLHCLGGGSIFLETVFWVFLSNCILKQIIYFWSITIFQVKYKVIIYFNRNNTSMYILFWKQYHTSTGICFNRNNKLCIGALWISYLYHWLKYWSRLNSKHCLKKTQNIVSSNIHTRHSSYSLTAENFFPPAQFSLMHMKKKFLKHICEGILLHKNLPK